ncbi:cell entry protein [Kouleothrix aurantiaca]|uniref:Cell entry protein n=1 Tax=Kouleothrix aurantiaca TaxID=186479 RepID=A0A0P9DWW8_9CHLR|nr:cell entry protein [Kouleothrix aurantiaca]
MSERNDFNQKIIDEFRANEGKVGGYFANTPLLLLHSVGAKSGKPRISPLAYVTDGDSLVIIASKGGAPSNPDWYYNVKANPIVTVEMGTEQFQARASIVEGGPERDRLYAAMVARNPGFAEYERNTTRTIPAVLLERIA